jgi:hypothetical protein
LRDVGENFRPLAIEFGRLFGIVPEITLGQFLVDRSEFEI